MAGTKTLVEDLGAKSFLPPCRVCGDKAAGFHYGVNTCEACKGFFHRSLQRHTEYKCRANRTYGFCEYRPGKRKSCQYCRYQRCLSAGMSKEAIKTGRYTYLKRTEDTQEIKRLQDLQQTINSAEQDSGATSVSSSSNVAAQKEERLEHATDSLPTFMEVDSTTADDYNTLSEQGNEIVCTSNDFSNSETSSPAISFANENTTSKTSNVPKAKNHYQGNQIQRKTKGTLLSKGHSSNHSESSVQSHVISMQQPLTQTRLDPDFYPDSSSDQGNGMSQLSNSELRLNFQNKGSNLVSHKPSEVLDQRKFIGKSIVFGVKSNSETEKVKGSSEKTTTGLLEFTEDDKCIDLVTDSSAGSQYASFTTDLSAKNTGIFCCNDSSSSKSLSVKEALETCKEDLAGETRDFFPEISFCLDGQPMSRPSSQASSDIQSPSVFAESSQLSSVSSQSPESIISISPAPSSGAVVLNLDNGICLKVSNDCNMEIDLCQTPESSYPMQDQNLGHNVHDNVTFQIMEEYTQGLEIIIESPPTTQVPTPVQTLLTSPSPRDLMSMSPLSPSGSDADYMNQASPASKLAKKVKNLQLSDIPELFSDKDAVIATLMASHKENIGDFNYMSKEEMTAQQKEHYESCQLKKQTFGELGFLPEQEYDDIYSVTGIDIDNRRMIIQKYLSRMERCVRGLVHFAKSIPGFSMLDISTQVELIKLARSEIAIFAVYPTVNLELGITLGLSGEQWACQYDMGKAGCHLAITEYMSFCDKLQKIAPTQEEDVLLKAILVVSTDRDSSVRSPLAEAVHWQLILCLIHSLEKHREQPGLYLARYILALTQSRTVAEKFKDFLRQLKMQKYSSIEQNPLMWELYSGILQEKDGETDWDKLYQHIGQGKAGMWSPCLLGFQ